MTYRSAPNFFYIV